MIPPSTSTNTKPWLVCLALAAPLVAFFVGVSNGADEAWTRAEAKSAVTITKTVPGPVATKVKVQERTPAACKELITEYRANHKLQEIVQDLPENLIIGSVVYYDALNKLAELAYSNDAIKELEGKCKA